MYQKEYIRVMLKMKKKTKLTIVGGGVYVRIPSQIRNDKKFNMKKGDMLEMSLSPKGQLTIKNTGKKIPEWL